MPPREEPDAGDAVSRREQIRAATLAVLAERGITGLTHRAVAAQAGVSVGLTTYYFKTRELLLAEVMEDALRQSRADFDEWLSDVTLETLPTRLADLIAARTGGRHSAVPADLIVKNELYYAALWIEDLRPISARWDQVIPTGLLRLVDAETARLLAAAISGLQTAAMMADQPVDRADATRLFGLIVDARR
ncbi:TetR family transcriptional regulator [Microbacterium sp. X-17]|uniref:TetR/AcrR family transcriptional regulator n=1 Tax=Microbacterium sp. X-17 TaxID=3144404 RepID=UPI0031F55FC8